MKRFVIFIAIMLVCVAIPSVSFTEDQATVRLAKTIYTLAADQDYSTKLDIGSVIMNRVDSPWYPNTLDGVLSQQQQFPCGTRYDTESMRAAHALISGERTLDSDIIALQWANASDPRGSDDLACRSGDYKFYYSDLHRPLN